MQNPFVNFEIPDAALIENAFNDNRERLVYCDPRFYEYEKRPFGVADTIPKYSGLL